MTKQKITIPKGWEVNKLKELLDYERPDKYIVKSTEYQENFKIPVLTANKSFVKGYTNEEFGICRKLPAIIFDDFTTDSKYVNFPFKVKSSAIKILRSKSEHANLKFLYEVIKSIHFPVGNHKRYYISEYQDIDVVVPPWNEQRKIAEILSKVDEDIEKTEDIIKNTEKLKKGLMQELFGKSKIKNQKSKLQFNIQNWEEVKLGEVCYFVNGKTPLRSKEEFWENGTIPWFTIEDVRIQGRIINKTNQHITEKALKGTGIKVVPKNTVLLCCTASIGEYAFTKIDITTNQQFNALVVEDFKKLRPDFLFSIASLFKKELEMLMGTTTFGFVSLEKLGSIKIILPSLNEQKQIANILSSIDDKIEINKQIKDKLTRLKKGLMGDLLSGKVRIKV